MTVTRALPETAFADSWAAARRAGGAFNRRFLRFNNQDAGSFAGQDWNLHPYSIFWRLKNYG
jgi:hypothetical protein